MPGILKAVELKKHFPGVKAVDGVSLEVKEGACFGLLGPNGAGKTTTIEMIEGISIPDQGQVFFKGKQIDKSYSKHIGIQFQHTALQDFLTVRDTLRLFMSFYDTCLPMDELIETMALGEFINRDTSRISGGQRQRLLLAIAMINDPQLIFLDEPTTGLDPQARHHFWNLISDIKKKGKTICLTTHYMEEAELLCDDIAIMDYGKIIASGKPEHLLREHFAGVKIVLPPGSGLEGRMEYPVMSRSDSGSEIIASNIEVTLKSLIDDGVSLKGMKIETPNLENLFLKLTGHALRV